MVRFSKLVIGLVVVGASGVIGLTYTGIAAPFLSPADLPGNALMGFGAIFALVFGGVILASILDTRAWKRMGREMGLSVEGGLSPLGYPDLTGTVRGRRVRAHTYSTGGGGESGTSTTYTVVETQLETPVEWNATFHQGSVESIPELQDIGSQQWTTVDDTAVFGDVSEEQARAVLSGRVRSALAGLDGDVSVGDREQNLRSAMLDALPDEGGGGMTQSLAEGMLSMGLDEEAASGPSRTVTQTEKGLLVDVEELDRRIEAVAALAEAIERGGAPPRA